jgi:hypothetical protein
MKIDFEKEKKDLKEVVLINGLRLRGKLASKIQLIADENRISTNKVVLRILESVIEDIEV